MLARGIWHLGHAPLEKSLGSLIMDSGAIYDGTEHSALETHCCSL